MPTSEEKDKKAEETVEKPAKKAAAAKPATKTSATKKATKAEETSAVDEKVRTLRVHDLKPAPGAKKAKIRVGRGEGSKGKTAGRGTKGTHARNTVRLGFEGGQMPMHMRLPKLRGFKNPFRVEFQVVNLERLEVAFPAGGDVTVEALVEAGLVRKNQLVKVLGQGDISVALNLTVDAWSASAKEKIEAAGGSLTAR